jgi:RNase P subunit RPR2
VNELSVLLIIFLTVAGSVGIGGGIAYFSYLREEREKATWKMFAQSNDLNFVPASLFGEGAHIVGDFHGHQIRIDTTRIDHRTHTRIILSLTHLVNSTYFSSNEIHISKTKLNGSFRTDTLHALKGKVIVRANKLEIHYDQLGVESDIEYLQSILVSLNRLVAVYPILLSLNEPVEAIISTTNEQLWPLTMKSLQEIAQDTLIRFSDRATKLLCPNCLTRFGRHRVRLSSGKDITYYGCRKCGQSHEFFEGKVIAVLNTETTMKRDEQDGILRVNWSLYKTLFDFDEIEVVQATDEEIEQFAVQVGNDTDFFRRPSYSKMYCRISSKCELSDNSIRILNRVFESVDYNHR